MRNRTIVNITRSSAKENDGELSLPGFVVTTFLFEDPDRMRDYSRSIPREILGKSRTVTNLTSPTTCHNSLILNLTIGSKVLPKVSLDIVRRSPIGNGESRR